MTKIDRLKKDTKVANKALAVTLTEAIHKMAAAKMPFLAWPVLDVTYKFFLNEALSFLLEKGAIWFNVVWIKLEVGQDAAEMEKARQKAIKLVETGAKDDELDKVDDELRRSFDRLRRTGRGPL